MEEEQELGTFPFPTNLYFCLDNLTNQLERLDGDNGFHDSFDNFEYCDCLDSLGDENLISDGDILENYKPLSYSEILDNTSHSSDSSEFNDPKNIIVSDYEDKKKCQSYKENEKKELCMNSVLDKIEYENVVLKSTEIRIRKESQNSLVSPSSGADGQDIVSRQNTDLLLADQDHHTFLPLADQEHINCQHHLSSKFESSESSFHQPSNVIEFLIYFGMS